MTGPRGVFILGFKNPVPGGIRTPNLLIRSQKLYPVELQALEKPNLSQSGKLGENAVEIAREFK